MTKDKDVNKKKCRLIFIIIGIVLIILASLSAYLYSYYNKHKYSFSLISDKIVVPLNTNIDPLNYIGIIRNAKVKYNSIKTDTIGDKKITYTVKDNLFKKKHKYNFTVTVVDNIPPVIDAKENVSLYVDSKIDLNTYAKVTDNYDKDIKIQIDGEVDNKKVGTYKVKYYAVDSSGNKAEHTITFNVKKNLFMNPQRFKMGL